jgi:membrane-associated phospholipid phosphatase
VKSYLYKKVSINNLVNVLIVIILVSSLKFVVGKARPFKAQSPFDYHLFSGLSIYKGRDANSSINDENRNCKFFLGWTICLIKERASFPSGETAIAFVQLFYLIHFVNFHYRIVIIFLAILAPLFRLLLYRHWFFDCAFSIFLGWVVVRFVEKFRKKYDYNKS